MHGAVALQQTIEIRVVHRPHHDMQPVTMQRMGKGRKFPSAEVRGQKQYSVPFGVGSLVIFQAVIDNHLLDIFRRIARKLAQLCQLPSQRCKNSAQNALSLRLAFFWKYHGEIAHPYLAQTKVQ